MTKMEEEIVDAENPRFYKRFVDDGSFFFLWAQVHLKFYHKCWKKNNEGCHNMYKDDHSY